MKNRKNFLNLALLGCFAMVFLGSCNRGYGCPYDFSAASSAEQLFNLVMRSLAWLF